MTKDEVIAILDEIAVLLELLGESPFKSRAYQAAARTLEAEEDDIVALVNSGKLSELPGFGEALTEKVTTLVTTGRLPYYEDLKKKIPQGLLQLVRVPGLGPKKAKSLYSHLKIDSLEALEKACREHKIREIEGFGEKSEQKILEGIAHLRKYAERHFYDEAWEAAQVLLQKLRGRKDVLQCEIAGSLRRRRETIGDLDFVASAEDPAAVTDFFTSLPEVAQVLGTGETKSSVVLKGSGIQADLRIVAEEEFPSALHHFTGSAEHNVLLRGRAKDKGLKLNEYGLFRVSDDKKIPCRSEEEIFKALGLSYIPPEIREGMWEIEAAERNKIPALIEEKDIRGVFHVHSTWSDGTASLEAMIAEAERLGLDYVGVSDHSQSAYYANGLKPDRVREQEKEIEKLRKKFKIRVFWGIESDILPDGRLDYPSDILERFDFVIASVHSAFTMSEKEMTARIVKALDNKHTTMLGHATGRLLLSREPYAVDTKAVIDAAADSGKVIELNASPQRFDIDWRLGPYLREKGVKVAINPDAHSLQGLSDYRYGVGIARKGWLTKEDVVTTFPVSRIEKILS